jgi:hypothetical protein
MGSSYVANWRTVKAQFSGVAKKLVVATTSLRGAPTNPDWLSLKTYQFVMRAAAYREIIIIVIITTSGNPRASGR